MAAVPFGFSFGDFVAAIEVIHKVAQALQRSSGARSHFHQTVADPESFETVLRRVEALSPTTSSPDTVEAIRLCAFKCHPPLNHFLQRIRLYEQHMGQPSGSKTQIMKSVTGSFWKAKWAIKVEEEVAKLKADIGPLLEAISVLLQIESRQQGATTHDAVKSLVDDVNSGFGRIMLAVQEHALATRRIDLRTIDMHVDTQTVMQKLPQLATSAQLEGLLSMIGSISTKVGSTAPKDQINHLRRATIAAAKRQKIQKLQMGRKFQDVHGTLGATRIFDCSYPHPVTTVAVGSPAPMPPPYRKPPGMPSHWSDQSTSADSRMHFRSIYRLLVSAVMVLVLMFPNIQSQLRTFMTLLKSPQLLSSNSITLTDALNRTKLLPYEYFSNWNLVQPWLERAFWDSPGESRVHRGEFALFTRLGKRTGPEIPVDRWKSSVFPAGHVIMSILALETETTKCQRCEAVLPLPSVSTGGIKCMSCGRSHHLTARELQQCDQGKIFEPQGNAQRNELNSKTGLLLDHHDDGKEAKEDGRFTHVHTGMLWPPDALHKCPPQEAAWNRMIKEDPLAREIEKLVRARRNVKRNTEVARQICGSILSMIFDV